MVWLFNSTCTQHDVFMNICLTTLQKLMVHFHTYKQMYKAFVVHILVMHIIQLPQKRNLPDENAELSKRLRSITVLHQHVYKNAEDNITKAQKHQKKCYDQRHTIPTFVKGHIVLRKNMANVHRMGGKLDARWIGPYKIEEVTPKNLYRLKCIKSGKILKQAFPSIQLKSYISRTIPKVSS